MFQSSRCKEHEVYMVVFKWSMPFELSHSIPQELRDLAKLSAKIMVLIGSVFCIVVYSLV